MNTGWAAVFAILILGQTPPADKAGDKSAEKATEVLLETRRLSAELDLAFRYQRRLAIAGTACRAKKDGS